MSRKRLSMTVSQALKEGIVERYYSRTHRRYFYATGAHDGFDTGSAALRHHLEVVKPSMEKVKSEEQKRRVLCGNSLVAVRRSEHVSVWDGPRCVFEGSIRKFRQRVFDLEERFGREIVFSD
ncbi:hypothetical protein [Geoalkalibacter subterraneus]|uniref:Uncharacterized protein n=1 Tax=Geoalkalibacter subterraneus TaxID=483547 RepID=A0A0B5FJB4_9BACT|nr:hypothetical protein [Geoalkalibacter subterraneus]AJF08262.1 hypothetical protein GSUB_17440 [Geoalkalibacter subterraneus]